MKHTELKKASSHFSENLKENKGQRVMLAFMQKTEIHNIKAKEKPKRWCVRNIKRVRVCQGQKDRTQKERN